jgi:hypothetical protein
VAIGIADGNCVGHILTMPQLSLRRIPERGFPRHALHVVGCLAHDGHDHPLIGVKSGSGPTAIFTAKVTGYSSLGVLGVMHWLPEVPYSTRRGLTPAKIAVILKWMLTDHAGR